MVLGRISEASSIECEAHPVHDHSGFGSNGALCAGPDHGCSDSGPGKRARRELDVQLRCHHA
eukprot:4790972-Pyramimonas_sp.AAC.1